MIGKRSRYAALLLLSTLLLLALPALPPLIQDRALRSRIIERFDTLERLAEKHATVAEVLDSVGEPTHRMRLEGTETWFYRSEKYHGHFQPTAVLEIDPKTRRVIGLGCIHIN